MKITTTIEMEVTNTNGLVILVDSNIIKTFIKDKSKIEDLVISQLQRFMKNEGVREPILAIESNLSACKFNYSSLEYFVKQNDLTYEVFIRVEDENGEKITFPDYWMPEIVNKQDKLRAIILENTIKKIKKDLIYDDESFLAAIISGEGFTQINRMSDEELESEYNEILSGRKCNE